MGRNSVAIADKAPFTARVKPWKTILDEIGRRDLAFLEASRKRDIHGVHPYPAKFTGSLPAALIDSIACGHGDVVDPFCGSGTTLVEALRRGHSASGFDANPVALLVSRAKITKLAPKDIKAIQVAAEEVRNGVALPDPTGNPLVKARNNGRVRFWFPPHAFQEIKFIKAIGEGMLSASQRAIWDVALSAIMVRVSHQDDETRYSWTEKGIEPWDTFQAFRTKLESVVVASKAVTSEYLSSQAGDGYVDFKDYSTDSPSLGDQCYDCAVFSPPYPNTFDYHLYHRLRLLFFGHNPNDLRRAEIGAHLKYEPDTQAYLASMRHALTSVYRSLRPGGVAAMVIGDSIVRGNAHDNAADLLQVATGVGFHGIGTVRRAIPAARKSFARSAERLREESVVLLGRPPAVADPQHSEHREVVHLVADDSQMQLFVGPAEPECLYPLQPLEEQLSREMHQLLSRHPLRREMHMLAPFCHTISEGKSGERQRTFQHFIDVNGTKTSKCTTYFGHGLHSYVGKFYPQIARQLLLNDAARKGLDPREVIVLDPFAGSGTTLVEACLMGSPAIGVELNPVAVMVAQGKLALLRRPFEESRRLIESVASRTEGLRPDPGHSVWEVEKKEYLRSWFPAPQLSELAALCGMLRELYPDPFGPGAVFYSLVSSIVRISSLQKPSDLRIRRRPPEEVTVSPFQAFRSRLLGLLHDLHAWERAAKCLPFSMTDAAQRSKVIHGDTVRAVPKIVPELKRSAACIVTSPPYAAALPYIDTDRLSLALLDLDSKHGDQRELESQMVGNREISTKTRRRGFDAIAKKEHHSFGSTMLNAFLEIHHADLTTGDGDAGFRRQNNPAIVFDYFKSLHSIIRDLAAVPRDTSFFILVAGNQMNTGTRELFLDTPQVLGEIAESEGWTVVRMLDKVLSSAKNTSLAHRKAKAMTDEVVIELRR